jgi:uncharacterized protein YlzI (FlbEa/FlbD family)
MVNKQLIYLFGAIIVLTRADGVPIWIQRDFVELLSPAKQAPPDCGKHCTTIKLVGSQGRIYVRESIDQILAKLKE